MCVHVCAHVRVCWSAWNHHRLRPGGDNTLAWRLQDACVCVCACMCVCVCMCSRVCVCEITIDWDLEKATLLTRESTMHLCVCVCACVQVCVCVCVCLSVWNNHRRRCGQHNTFDSWVNDACVCVCVLHVCVWSTIGRALVETTTLTCESRRASMCVRAYVCVCVCECVCVRVCVYVCVCEIPWAEQWRRHKLWLASLGVQDLQLPLA